MTEWDNRSNSSEPRWLRDRMVSLANHPSGCFNGLSGQVRLGNEKMALRQGSATDGKLQCGRMLRQGSATDGKLQCGRALRQAQRRMGSATDGLSDGWEADDRGCQHQCVSSTPRTAGSSRQRAQATAASAANANNIIFRIFMSSNHLSSSSDPQPGRPLSTLIWVSSTLFFPT